MADGQTEHHEVPAAAHETAPMSDPLAQDKTDATAPHPMKAKANAEDSAVTDQAKKKQRPPIVVLGVKVPDFAARGIYKVSDVVAGWRRATLEATPAVLVNNSSRVMAVLQIISEIFMLRASAVRAQQPWVSDTSNPMNYITQPPARMWKDLTGNLAPVEVDYKKLFSLKGPKYAYNRLMDLPEATAREQRAIDKIRETDPTATLSLPNRWQSRSTLMGLLGWGLNLLLPERPETKEDIEKMTELAKRNKPLYVLERFRQALWIPEWTKHKRQVTGLGVMCSGICSMIGSLRNRDGSSAVPQYAFNGGYFLTGASTFLSSLPLLFAVDNDKGYSEYGMLHLLRIPFLVPNLSTKFSRKEPGVNWYATGAAGFQIQNLSGVLLGGGRKEKQPDGTYKVVDPKAIREEAREKAVESIAQRKAQKNQHGESVANDNEHNANDNDSEKPATQVSHAREAQMAMPERRTTAEEALKAAAVAPV